MLPHKSRPTACGAESDAVGSSPLWRLSAALGAALTIAALLWFQFGQAQTSALPGMLGGPFALTDQNGRAVTEASWPGKRLMLFFGYRFCPDVCPTELNTMAEVLNRLGDDAQRIQPLFISVDPERDLPETLRDFVTLFHPKIIGLTGTKEQVAAAAKAFRAYYRKSGEGEGYSVDHSAFTYLTDDHGRVLTLFGPRTTVEKMTAAIRDFLSRS
ncbi:protein SCO1 [uncultured Gammaproteobacteria bacterium]